MTVAFSIRKELDGDGDMAVVDDGYAAMFIKPARMIELRDLLLREFPVAAEQPSAPDAEQWYFRSTEPDPDEVRRILDHNPHNNNPVAAAARAWLRSREQQPQSNSDRAFNNGWDAGWAAATSDRRERRARIATTLFAGMLANSDTHATAVLAVSYADSLIAALDKEQP